MLNLIGMLAFQAARGTLTLSEGCLAQKHLIDNMMQHLERYLSALIVCLLLLGCDRLPFGAQPTLPPTFDPALLTVTPAPSLTPLPTYTPPPTAMRLPSDTPPPTFAPVITQKPVTPQPTRPALEPSPTYKATAIPLTPTSYIGIFGLGPEIPELVPILTFSSNAVCRQWMLAQIGVINRGNVAALDFTVEWTFGWGEPQRVHIEALEWNAGPLYLFSGLTAVHCSDTASLKAWVRVDVDNTVAEAVEDNNYQEEVYTVVWPSATPSP
jgi:hypothetical protein